MHFFTNLKSFKTIQWMDSSMDSYIVEMSAILDSLLHKVVDTTSSPIGVEGGGWWGAPKWQDLLIQENLSGQMTSIQAVFSSKYHKM